LPKPVDLGHAAMVLSFALAQAFSPYSGLGEDVPTVSG
jgi:hypothetical protein